ncbi:hypothetical protein C2857_000288 [Epichloe festucae Fl1]|uniref:Nucleolar protein NOP52 variant n=1 Tax=Epichloe festucae (strain Fl1) TaxID=877507 RepID=A0A7S9KR72_EPIFF|nr:hypothetical protein C2857_000288 [Epichloe festucae Fl1]
MTAPDPQAAQMPFIKNLASSDRQLRTRSLAALQAFLSQQPSLTPPSALKLWTGLYYALWMTDQPRPQQALASELASLPLDLPASSVAPFLRAFWQVLSGQWALIDALRMDKFLLLVRRVFAAHVRLAREKRWEGDTVDSILEVLGTECFDVGERRGVALGLRLHALDLWVDEMERERALGDKAETVGDDDVPRGQFVRNVGRLVERLRRSPVKSVRARASESYADERLPWGGEASDKEGGDEDEEGGGWGGFED